LRGGERLVDSQMGKTRRLTDPVNSV
jgi:hypothetical protein